jgi:hypothetical protein
MCLSKIIHCLVAHRVAHGKRLPSPAQHSLNFSDQKTGTKSAQMVIIAIVKVLLIMNQTPPGAVVAKTDKFSVI